MARSASDWLGYLPPSRYPFAMNPPQGFLASANQQPVDPRVNPSYMGSDWYSPWRAMRINSLLRDDSAVTPDAMRRFQTDPGSARADAFVPQFLAAAAREDSAGRADATLRDAAKLLAEWDRRYTKENRRAALFEKAMEELNNRTWDELLAGDSGAANGRSPRLPESQVLLELMRDPTSKWWDDRRTPGVVETRDAILTASLRAALVVARKVYGSPAGDGWLWSNVRHANIYHLARIPALSALDLPVQGGPSTLSPSGGSGTQGPSWRMVVELGPDVRAWATYPGRAIRQSGQSFLPGSSQALARGTACAGSLSEDPGRSRSQARDIDSHSGALIVVLSKAVKFLLLTEAFAVATYAVGWWGVPVLALICGLAVDPKARPVRICRALCGGRVGQSSAARCGARTVERACPPFCRSDGTSAVRADSDNASLSGPARVERGIDWRCDPTHDSRRSL